MQAPHDSHFLLPHPSEQTNHSGIECNGTEKEVVTEVDRQWATSGLWAPVGSHVKVSRERWVLVPQQRHSTRQW